ncbi:MAG TPA: ribbon-helix-helix protein, CopG family [Kofleriaceae bacterium]
MAVDRLSVTVPSELGAALRALAEARHTTVSTVVTEAIAHQIRLAALDLALEDADRKFGPVAAELIAKADAELFAKPRRKTRRR